MIPEDLNSSLILPSSILAACLDSDFSEGTNDFIIKKLSELANHEFRKMVEDYNSASQTTGDMTPFRMTRIPEVLRWTPKFGHWEAKLSYGRQARGGSI